MHGCEEKDLIKFVHLDRVFSVQMGEAHLREHETFPTAVNKPGAAQTGEKEGVKSNSSFHIHSLSPCSSSSVFSPRPSPLPLLYLLSSTSTSNFGLLQFLLLPLLLLLLLLPLLLFLLLLPPHLLLLLFLRPPAMLLLLKAIPLDASTKKIPPISTRRSHRRELIPANLLPNQSCQHHFVIPNTFFSSSFFPSFCYFHALPFFRLIPPPPLFSPPLLCLVSLSLVSPAMFFFLFPSRFSTGGDSRFSGVCAALRVCVCGGGVTGSKK